ncbi:type II toxin-antitoxin system HicA family toxin [Thermodesulfobacteriota bacterium]
MVAHFDTILSMNRQHRKTLANLFTDPVSGNIEWRRIEALFKAVGCEIIEGRGSRITIVHEGRKAAFHRPHPGKDALRYQILAARDFLKLIGVTP